MHLVAAYVFRTGWQVARRIMLWVTTSKSLNAMFGAKIKKKKKKKYVNDHVHHCASNVYNEEAIPFVRGRGVKCGT